jgi:tetratricopeptide (TPR) repeat protein
MPGEPRIISRRPSFGVCLNSRVLSGLTGVNDNGSVPRGHRLRLRVVLLAGALAAVAAGQEPPPPPTPCPADAAAPEPRDVLVASDVSAASRDESRAGDLLAAAAERGAVTLWPLDWLTLARRDEARGDFTPAAARYRRYQASLEGSGEDTRWVEPRVKLLELASKTAAGAGVLPEARLALADARAALSRGDSKAAREKLGYAMRLDPRYVEPAIAAGSLDAQQGRTSDAIRDYRQALAADPERVEAAVPLSNLLWEHPDRASKAESLLLLDRAAAARPDLPPLLRRSAERWAQWGDPKAALQRLDEWRAVASPAERKQTDPLRAELAAKLPAADPAKDAPAPLTRRRADPPGPRTAAVETSSGFGKWIWGAGVAVLVALSAAVLSRRRRAVPEEPAEPVPEVSIVRVEDFSRFLQSAASERQLTAPPLSTRGFPAEGQPWTVRVPPPDWEAIWRTVFASTLAATRSGHVAAPRLALFASLVRDANASAGASGSGASVRFALADNGPGVLTTEMIRAHSAGRDWATVEDAIRAHKGSIAVAQSIDKQFTKRLLIELPAG